MGKIKDLTGQRFGRLTVIKINGRTKDKSVTWLCRCDCGNETIVVGQNLSNGNTKSCGCYHKEVLLNASKTHGMTHTKIYNIWADMKTRCTNKKEKNYKNYGGRGVKICDKWLSFNGFYDDMGKSFEQHNKKFPGKNTSLDRIDFNGNYEPSNCKWSTILEQANNKTTNVLVTIDGIKDTITNHCRRYNISDRTVFSRIYTGWDIEKALKIPVLNPLDNLKYHKNSL